MVRRRWPAWSTDTLTCFCVSKKYKNHRFTLTCACKSFFVRLSNIYIFSVTQCNQMNGGAPSLISLCLVPALKPRGAPSRLLSGPEMRRGWEERRTWTRSRLKGTDGGGKKRHFWLKASDITTLCPCETQFKGPTRKESRDTCVSIFPSSHNNITHSDISHDPSCNTLTRPIQIMAENIQRPSDFPVKSL